MEQNGSQLCETRCYLVCMCTCVCMQVQVRMHTSMCIYACVCICTQCNACIRIYVRTCVCMFMYTCGYMHLCTYVCVGLYTIKRNLSIVSITSIIPSSCKLHSSCNHLQSLGLVQRVCTNVSLPVMDPTVDLVVQFLLVKM